MELELTAKQSWAWEHILNNPRYDNILFDGGARSGKTYLILIWLVTCCTHWPGMKDIVLRKHRAHAESKVWPDLCDIVHQLDGWDTKQSTLTAHCENGSTIALDGLDDKKRAEKILGGEYAQIFVNEAVQTTWEILQLLMTRCSQNIADPWGNPAPQQLLIDTNPRNERHWLHKVGIQGLDPDSGDRLEDVDGWARLSWSPYDNPHLSERYRKRLDHLPQIMRNRMRDGIWCSQEGLVYSMFDPDVHVVDDATMPEGWETWRCAAGVDWGFRDPMVFLWGCWDSDHRLYITGEVYVTGRTVRDICLNEIKPERRAWDFVSCDHDPESMRVMEEALDCRTMPADKSSIRSGIDRIIERLQVQADGRPRLYIHSRCLNLIREMFLYREKDPHEDKNNDENPVDADNHAPDALRYLVGQLDRGAQVRIT